MTNMVNRIELKIDLTRICDRSKRKHAIVIFLQGHTSKSSSFLKLFHCVVHLNIKQMKLLSRLNYGSRNILDQE